MVIVRDELSGWVKSMNQYRGGKVRTASPYLSTWVPRPSRSTGIWVAGAVTVSSPSLRICRLSVVYPP